MNKKTARIVAKIIVVRFSTSSHFAESFDDCEDLLSQADINKILKEIDNFSEELFTSLQKKYVLNIDGCYSVKDIISKLFFSKD